MFFKVSVLYYAAISGFRQLMNFQSHDFLVFIFGSFIVIYSVTIANANEHYAWLASGAAAIYSTLFLILLPAVTLITAASRGFFKKAETIAS
jgi:hypothetical protein